MKQPDPPHDLVTLRDLTISNSDEITAIVAVLERKGLLMQLEVVDEIKRLRKKAGKVREPQKMSP